MYNSKNTIEKCLNSICRQTFKDIQIIIVNDGSTDGCEKIIEKIRVYDNRIYLFNRKNSGVSNARNYGIKNALGKYICFVDSDDVIDTGLINELYNVAVKYSIDMTCCEIIENNRMNVHSYEKNNKVIIAKDKITIGKYLYDMNSGRVFGKLFNASIIKKNDLEFKEFMALAEDMEFVHRFMRYANSIAKISNSFYYLEDVNSNSLSKQYAANMLKTLAMYKQTMQLIFKKYPNYEQYFNRNQLNIDVECCVKYINNFFLIDSPYKGVERVLEIKKYLLYENHINAFFERKIETANLKIDKIYYLIFKSKNVYLISLLFFLKEKYRNFRRKSIL